MHRFFNGEKEIEIPTALEELTPEQYQYLITLASIFAASPTFTEDDLRVRWLSYLGGLKNMDYTLLTAERQRFFDDAMPATDRFFTRSGGGRLMPLFDTPANLLPEIGGYKGVGDWLEGLNFGEFVECLSLMGDLGGDDESAGREAFERISRILYHIPEQSSVPDILLFHAPTLLRNVWNKIISGPIEINGNMLDLSIIFKPTGGKSRPDDKTGWTGITLEVAETGIFGDMKGVESSDFWMVLIYLYRCKFDYLHSGKGK